MKTQPTRKQLKRHATCQKCKRRGTVKRSGQQIRCGTCGNYLMTLATFLEST